MLLNPDLRTLVAFSPNPNPGLRTFLAESPNPNLNLGLRTLLPNLGLDLRLHPNWCNFPIHEMLPTIYLTWVRQIPETWHWPLNYVRLDLHLSTLWDLTFTRSHIQVLDRVIGTAVLHVCLHMILNWTETRVMFSPLGGTPPCIVSTDICLEPILAMQVQIVNTVISPSRFWSPLWYHPS